MIRISIHVQINFKIILKIREQKKTPSWKKAVSKVSSDKILYSRTDKFALKVAYEDYNDSKLKYMYKKIHARQ